MITMQLNIEVPDSIARQLHLHGPQGKTRALEMLALEGYRDGELSRGQVAELLGLGFHESEQFLNDHHAVHELTIEEFDADARSLHRVLGR